MSWTTSNSTSVSISPTVGTVSGNGSTTVSPATTTSYTISATGADGKTVTAVVTVTVTGSAIPQIVAFTATPQTVSSGQSTADLLAGDRSDQYLDRTGRRHRSFAANACSTVTPSATTTYTLTATNAVGQVQGNLTVNVGSVQILSFQANPGTTNYGDPTVLSWTTANATSVVLTAADLPAMTLPVNGSYTDHPTTNETYTLTAYGPGGQTVSVTISVFVR